MLLSEEKRSRNVAQLGSASILGVGGHGFKSYHSDSIHISFHKDLDFLYIFKKSHKYYIDIESSLSDISNKCILHNNVFSTTRGSALHATFARVQRLRARAPKGC